ncbi:MAG TPA: hypothetical protein VMW37_04815 [Dehalococcoidales bacterium]|nr:hypothetical protein [Dehalococcoidales bacterium]
MAKKEPLYPHVPKGKEVQFPHTTARMKGGVVGELQPGQVVRLRSGTEGWVRGTIVEYSELIPSVGGVILTGPGYKVRVTEGKHQGEVLRLPSNYVEAVS